MEKVEICCLKGIGNQPNDAKIISLENKSEVVIGRAVDATVSIQSDMISRRHAILTKSAEGWTIHDNKSLNGVFVNQARLAKGREHILKDGDKVQVGVALKTGQPPPFIWVYKTKLKVKKIKKTSDNANESGVDQYHISSQKSICDVNDRVENAVEKESTVRKRSRSPDPCSPSTSGTSCSSTKKQKMTNIQSPSKEERKRQEQEFLEKQKAQEQQMRAMREEQERVQAQLREMQAQKERAEAQLQQALSDKERQIKETLHRQQEELERQREELEERLRADHERELKQREQQLIAKLTHEKNRLIEEKCKVERSLHEEMERKLDEKDKTLEERLRREKESLERVIDQKETEQRFLISELDEFKEDNEKQKADALKEKETLLSDFADLMETELQCSICSELLIKATSLNCSHSFCALCIEQWMEVKKQCPVCRADISSHLHSLVLDSYIDRMVEHLSDDMKERRKNMIQERKEEAEKRESEKRAKQAAAAASRGGGRRRARGGRRGGGGGGGGRGRGGRRGRRGATPLVISSESSSSSSDTDSADEDNSNNNNFEYSNSELDSPAHLVVAAEVEIGTEEVASEVEVVTLEDSYPRSRSSDSESSLEGATGMAYYGGYGSCFSCGRRGHWANDCPFDY